VVKDINEDNVGDGAVVKRESVRILNAIKPRIGEDVGAQTVWQDLSHVAESGAHIDGNASLGW
jgi:hypothetical protein